MNVYEAIYARKTMRDFQEIEIDKAVITKILDAGLHAPTNNHMRQWEFMIINDQATRLKVIDKIAKHTTKEDLDNLIVNWGLTDPIQQKMYIDGVPKQYQMLLTAGCLIIPCFQQKGPLLKPKNLSSLNGFASIWCCIENILLAAAAEGIFGVARIPFDEEIGHIREVLNIPEDYAFPCYLALGYPSETAGEVIQHEIKAEDRMHFDEW